MSARAFASTWRAEELYGAETSESAWTAYQARVNRYKVFEGYYHNTIYDGAAGSQMIANERLNRFIRGIYNPVGRYVDLMTAYTYGGMLDMRTAQTGAIPVEAENEAVYPALCELWKASRWAEQKNMYARRGYMLGDSIIKAVDDQDAERIRLEALHPSKLREARFDEVGNIVSAVIEYIVDDEDDLNYYKPNRFGVNASSVKNKSFTYTEIITKESFRTFKNGEPFAFYVDENGNGITEWENEFGFVPIALGNDSDTGMHWGAPRFNRVRRKINEANDLASNLHNAIRNVINPLLWAEGVTAKAKIDVAAEEKDAYRILYAPSGGKLNSLVPDINIADTAQELQNTLAELEADLPVLALPRIRQMGSEMTAPGIEAGYSDAIRFVEDGQGMLDGALIRAHKMALTMGGIRGYKGYEAFNADSYNNGDEEHIILPRPVIQDKINKSTRAQLLKDAGAPLGLILREMGGFTDDEIEEAVNTVASREDAKARQAVRALAENQFGAMPPIDDEDHEHDEDE